MRVRRVYWWTDWWNGVRYALKQLREAMFGCQHDWETIRFKHVDTGQPSEFAQVAVNRCAKCGRYHSFGAWWKPTKEGGW